MSKSFRKCITGILVLSLSFAISCPAMQAKSARDTGEIIYQNDNLIKEDKELEKIAKPVQEKDSKFELKGIGKDRLYSEDGKVYKIKSTDLKEVTQKISTKKQDSNTIDEYVSDCFATLVVEEQKTDNGKVNSYGLRGIKNTLFNVSPLSCLSWSNEAQDGGYSMKIRYTVYYSYLSQSGNLSNLYAFKYSYGKVVETTSVSGVDPIEGEFYVSLYGKTFDSTNNVYPGTGSYGDTETVSYPDVGEQYAYYFDLGPDDIYYQVTDSHSCGTSWTVTATRGVDASVSFNP